MAGDSSNGGECARRPTDADAAARARCQSSIAIGEDGGEFVFVFSFKRRRTSSSWREIVTNSGLSLLDRCSVVVLFFGLIVGQGATCRRHTRYRSRSSPFSSPE